MKRYGRVDQNQRSIAELFEAHGCHVHICSDFGGGFADLLAGWRDRIALVEVKRGKNPLTPDQVKFHAVWPVFTVRDDRAATEVVRWLKRNEGTK